MTFDDAYQDNLVIKEYLKEKGIKPLVFALSESKSFKREGWDDNDKNFLNSNELNELKDFGWNIGSHSKTHIDFSELNKNKLKDEINGSKIELEKRLGYKIDYFSYPFGEYTEEAKIQIAESGYSLAFSMDEGIINQNTDKYSIPRVGVEGNHAMFEFKVIYSKQAMFIRRIIKKMIRLMDFEKINNKLSKINIIQKIKMFFINRLVTVDKKHNAPLPESIDDYFLIDIIDRPKGDNQYQFGIYQNKKGGKGILKMWDGEQKDGDWFWLNNEIKTYEGLDELFKLNGKLIKEKFPQIRLPDLIKRVETNNSLGLFMEMIEGEALNQEKTMQAIVLKFEQAIKYFQYLGKLIAWSSLEGKFVRRNNVHTVLIFIYMILRASWMYPKYIQRFALALILFLFNSPSLLKSNEMAFVHRDLTYTNVYSLNDGRIGVIDFEIAVLTNPMYEITQSVTSSWHLKGFWQEFYKLDIMKEIFKDKIKFKTYKALTIFTGIHRLATSPKKEFDSHYSYFEHGLKLKKC